MDTATVLELFDRQMRREARFADPDVRVERTARTTLAYGEADADAWSAVIWSDLDEGSADAEIARAVGRLRELGREVEWKLYAHDRPADLGGRLAAAGLAPEDEEAVLVAELDELPAEPPLPAGVELRLVRDAGDVADFLAVNEQVFGGRHDAVGRALLRALGQDPPGTVGVVARAAGRPVAAARLELGPGSDFASIWGGGTIAGWRGRGLYRGTVALRGRIARKRGYRYLQVDALPTSAPILERLGFVRLASTTPYTAG